MKSLLYGLTVCLLALLCVVSTHVYAQQTDSEIPAAQLLQPAELVQILNSSASEKPLILQVGSHVLYAEAHIPGSEYLRRAISGARRIPLESGFAPREPPSVSSCSRRLGLRWWVWSAT